MSLFSRDDQSSDSRPILPPIRDLFGDELSRSPRFLHESAAMALARLSVSDREESQSRSDVAFSDPFHSKRPQETNRYSDSPRSSPRSLPPLLPDQGRSEYRGRLTESPARFTPPLRNHSLHDRYKLSRSSFSSRERSERRSTAPEIYPDHHLEKRRSLDMYRSSTEPSPSPRPLPRMISTEFKSIRRRDDDDDDPTPVARQNGRAPPFGNDRPQPPPTKSLLMSVSSAFKYECTYCGKGFNRPSSLKIHINSHTGEKPFTCTVEGCGRSFSVLSNMRRHARVHNVTPAGPEASSDDGSDLPPSPPHSASSFSSGASSRRRDSIASTSSSMSSRRSRSPSFDLDETDAPPEKRLRH